MVVIFEAPDQSAAAAIEVAARAPGHLTAVKTTPLLSVEEGMEAMRKPHKLARLDEEATLSRCRH